MFPGEILSRYIFFSSINPSKVTARTVLVAAFDALCIKSGVLYLGVDHSRGGAGGGSFRKRPDGRWGEVVAKIPSSPSGFLWGQHQTAFLAQTFQNLLPLPPPFAVFKKFPRNCYPLPPPAPQLFLNNYLHLYKYTK
jgi:hypothetical protein